MGKSHTLQFVVTFVDERGAVGSNAVLVGRPWLDRHEQHRICTSEAEVHAASQSGALAATHVEVGNECLGHLRSQFDSWREKTTVASSVPVELRAN